MSEGSPFGSPYHNESVNKDSHLKVSEVSNKAFEKDEDENELVLSCYDLERPNNSKDCDGTPLDSEGIIKDIKDVLNNSEGLEILDNATFTKSHPDLMNCNFFDPPSSPTVNNNNADENVTNFEQLAGQDSSDKLARQESSENYVTLFDRHIKKVPSTNELKDDESALQTPSETPADASDANFVIEKLVFTSASYDISNAEKGIPAKVAEDETKNQKLQDNLILAHNVNGSVSSLDSAICNETGNNSTKTSDINSSGNVNSKIDNDDIIYYLKIRKSSSDISKKNLQNSSEGINPKSPDNSLAKITNDQRENFINSKFSKSCPLHKSESIPNINENATNDNEPLLSKRDKFRPIYRLSMRLSQSVFGNIDIPNADTHRQYDKAGYLLKLSGRGFPYLHQWKRRYCILTKSALYVYEKENSRGCEKNSFIIDLKYFDHVAEAMQKESKKAPNVFVVTSQDRSFFDPGRHLFSADTLTDMHEWISKLKEAVELIRNNNRPTSKMSSAKSAEEKTLKEIRQSLNESLKGPTSRRRSKEIADIDENRRIPGQLDQDAVDSKTVSINMIEADLKASLEKKRKRESAQRKSSQVGTDMSETVEKDDTKDEEEEVKLPRKKSSTKRVVLQSPATLDSDSRPLESITKNRNKGPQGRRAPQSRRTVLIKQRASSMSALQHGGPNEDSARSGSAQGFRASVQTTDGTSTQESSSNLDITSDFSKSVDLESHEASFKIDDIDSDLFFKRPECIQEVDESITDSEKPKTKDKNRLSRPKSNTFSLRNFRFSKTDSSTGLSKRKNTGLFRVETFIGRFRSSGSPTAAHTDETKATRRCVIL